MKPCPPVLHECSPDESATMKRWLCDLAREAPGTRIIIVPQTTSVALMRSIFHLPSGARKQVLDILEPGENLATGIVQALSRAAISESYRMAGLLCGDEVLDSVALAVLKDHGGHTTLAHALSRAGVSRRSYVSATQNYGWAPPTQHFWALRVLFAHEKLRMGMSVRDACEAAGLQHVDSLRRQFRRVLNLTPSRARNLTPSQLLDWIRRTGTTDRD